MTPFTHTVEVQVESPNDSWTFRYGPYTQPTAEEIAAELDEEFNRDDTTLADTGAFFDVTVLKIETLTSETILEQLAENEGEPKCAETHKRSRRTRVQGELTGMTTVEAAAQLGDALTVLVDAGKVDYIAAANALMSTPPSSEERDHALTHFNPTINTPGEYR